MKRIRKGIALALLVVLALLLVVPLVIPIPPLQGTVPPEQLAAPDSQFASLNGLRVHYKKYGEGKPAFILLHGFGASTFSWEPVLREFGALGTTIAYDRPAFGLTSRPLPDEWQGGNPYSAASSVELLKALLDAQNIERAILVGNSAGGATAMDFALAYPERVQALILVDAAIYEGGGRPVWLAPLFALPQIQRLGPWLVRGIARRGDALLQAAWHDPSKITSETIAGYRMPLRADHWDVALWEFTKAAEPRPRALRLGELKMPVLVVSGDDDRIVPPANSIRLAQEIPDAKLAVLQNCGHLPQEECPEAFLQAVRDFVTTLPVAAE